MRTSGFLLYLYSHLYSAQCLSSGWLWTILGSVTRTTKHLMVVLFICKIAKTAKASECKTRHLKIAFLLCTLQ